MVATSGTHTCAVLSDRTARCWGFNSVGQIGDGTTQTRLIPVVVPALQEVIEITTGWQHTCALLAGQSVRCWGDNQFGQLGDGTQENRLTPVDVPMGL
jgi:alpha-tubulin suppressor-like RCC1 family protein